MIHMPMITLSDEEKRKLMEISQAAPDLLMHRARLILAYAEGKPTLQAALAAGISRGRARFWKRQFFAKRMDIFTQDEANVTGADEQAENLEQKSEEIKTEPLPIEPAEPEMPINLEVPYPERP